MKKKFFTVLLIIFALVFVGSATALIVYFTQSNKEKQNYDNLASSVETIRQNVLAQIPLPDPENPDAEPEITVVPVEDPKTGQVLWVLPEYAHVFEMNPDTVGWIQIPGTRLNYPVTQTPDNPNYYLKRNFYKEASSHGCIYAQEDCDIFKPSDNITLYGHFMRDGSMFAVLSQYKSKSFWESHGTIRFDTITKRQEYEIFAVFLTTASLGEGFAYNTFVDAWDEESYNAFVKRCKNLSLYDTGITPTYGDKLITLSTCEYSQVNGRLVVVARAVD
jgi:sortase B